MTSELPLTVTDLTRPSAQERPHLWGLATIALDADGTVIRWSSGAVRLFGLEPHQVLGRDIRESVLPGQRRETVGEMLALAADGRVWSGALDVDCADGSEHEVTFRTEPLTGPEAEVSVLVTAVRTSLPHTPGNGAGSAAAQRSALLNETITRIGSTLDLTKTAREAIDVAVPQFADAAGFYVLEHLVDGDEVPAGEGDGFSMVRRLAVGANDRSPQEWAAAFPVDEVIIFPADTPYSQCMASGKPLLFSTLGTDATQRLEERSQDRAAVSELLEHTSFLVVPLRARCTVLGFAAFTRSPARDALGEQDVTLAQEIAARAAVCIDNARLYGQARRTALALQASLLPEEITPPAGLEIAHRYQPASGTIQIGGDWYDMIPLSDGRAALVVGDAMGHDSTAAAAMVQLRTAARTLADLELPAAEVLYRLDRMAQQMEAAQFATCVYLTCDPARNSVTIACAGHIPPVLVHPDGTAERLDLPPGLPLGIGGAAYESTQLQVPDGATLVLCTDGLVESRDRDIDTGMRALQDVLTETDHPLEDICDTVINTVRSRRGMDDITLLLARLTRPRPG